MDVNDNIIEVTKRVVPDNEKSINTSEKAIEVTDVVVSFVQKDVLKKVSWTVHKGEIATLLGPNGCGKSTLLKVIMGSQSISNGQVEIFGKNLHKYSAPELARKVAFLPQVQVAPKDMVVEELIACGRYPYQKWWRSTDGEDRIIIERAMAATKTTHLANQLVSSLSGGERQRVWIAMALAQEPEILILDEPTTYLDINHQFEVLELIKRLNREQNLTVLMVLHELNQAARYSDRVAILNQGTIAVNGHPKEVMNIDILKDVFKVDAIIEKEKDDTIFIKVNGLI